MNIPALVPALDIHGDLILELDGDTLHINAEGSHLQINASSVGILQSLAQSMSGQIPLVESYLNQAQLSVEICLSSVPIARLGHGVQPNLLGSLAGVSGADVSLSGLLRAFLR